MGKNCGFFFIKAYFWKSLDSLLHTVCLDYTNGMTMLFAWMHIQTFTMAAFNSRNFVRNFFAKMMIMRLIGQRLCSSSSDATFFKKIKNDLQFSINCCHYYFTNYFFHVWLLYRWKFTLKRWVKVKLLSCLSKDELASKRLVIN